MNKTINYYNKNAKKFTNATLNVDFKSIQNLFLKKLPQNAFILDFGCGAGRDTKYFLQQGYAVEAIDGSEELCKIASEYTGCNVKQMFFHELNEKNKYDAIWACSSILHLPKTDLADVLQKMITALKKQGIIYTSFKYGEFEGERNGRYFTDFTLETFSYFLQPINEISIEEHWLTGDVRQGRGDERWLNIILRKH